MSTYKIILRHIARMLLCCSAVHAVYKPWPYYSPDGHMMEPSAALQKSLERMGPGEYNRSDYRPPHPKDVFTRHYPVETAFLRVFRKGRLSDCITNHEAEGKKGREGAKSFCGSWERLESRAGCTVFSVGSHSR